MRTTVFWGSVKKWGIRAGWFVVICTAFSMVGGAVSWIYAKASVAMVTPIVRGELKVKLDEFEGRLASRITSEGRVRDIGDSLILVRIGRVEDVTRQGVYTRREVDDLLHQIHEEIKAIRRQGRR